MLRCLVGLSLWMGGRPEIMKLMSLLWRYTSQLKSRTEGTISGFQPTGHQNINIVSRVTVTASPGLERYGMLVDTLASHNRMYELLVLS